MDQKKERKKERKKKGGGGGKNPHLTVIFVAKFSSTKIIGPKFTSFSQSPFFVNSLVSWEAITESDILEYDNIVFNTCVDFPPSFGIKSSI
jgi:hypothetical protein